MAFIFGKDFSSDLTLARYNPLVYTQLNGSGAYGVKKGDVAALSYKNLLNKIEKSETPNVSKLN